MSVRRWDRRRCPPPDRRCGHAPAEPSPRSAEAPRRHRAKRHSRSHLRGAPWLSPCQPASPSRSGRRPCPLRRRRRAPARCLPVAARHAEPGRSTWCCSSPTATPPRRHRARRGCEPHWPPVRLFVRRSRRALRMLKHVRPHENPHPTAPNAPHPPFPCRARTAALASVDTRPWSAAGPESRRRRPVRR
ncbi:Uncharacterised protein [Mycobacterium tuberculosis]|uniref:Uncharacterized protein n=1 Tax=Mycobacterium tuberculosis TaxID=1773 RepID=A0A655J103_MYCTX|nr:Uncharacterised protein [Mycobacterium tuberculosis]